MRGLIATTALLAGVQAAVDPIVIKVRHVLCLARDTCS